MELFRRESDSDEEEKYELPAQEGDLLEPWTEREPQEDFQAAIQEDIDFLLFEASKYDELEKARQRRATMMENLLERRLLLRDEGILRRAVRRPRSHQAAVEKARLRRKKGRLAPDLRDEIYTRIYTRKADPVSIRTKQKAPAQAMRETLEQLVEQERIERDRLRFGRNILLGDHIVLRGRTRTVEEPLIDYLNRVVLTIQEMVTQSEQEVDGGSLTFSTITNWRDLEQMWLEGRMYRVLQAIFTVILYVDVTGIRFALPSETDPTRRRPLTAINLLMLYLQDYLSEDNRESRREYYERRPIYHASFSLWNLSQLKAHGLKKIKTKGIHKSKQGIGFSHTFYKNIPCLFTAFFVLTQRGRENINTALSIADPVLLDICKRGAMIEFREYMKEKHNIFLPVYFKQYSRWLYGDESLGKVMVVDNEHCGIVGFDLVQKHIAQTTKKAKTFVLEYHKPNSKPKKIIDEYFFDIESVSHDGLQVPYLIAVYEKNSKEYEVFWGSACVKKFGEYLKRLNNGNDEKVFWGFNSGKYDLMLILKELTFDCCVVRGTMTTIKQLVCGKIIFNDLLCLLPIGSLRKQCELWGVETQKLSCDVADKQEEYFELHKNEIIKYCMADVKATQEILAKFMSIVRDEYTTLDLDPRYCATLAGLTTKIFTQYLADEIEGSSGQVYKNERESYYGGVCYHTMSEMQDAFYYDINSSYPFAMMKQMPFQYIESKEYMNEALIEYNLYECEFEYNKDVICSMTPQRTKDGLEYRIKIERSWRWGAELLFLTKHEKINSLIVYNVQLYKPKQVFAPFITDMYEKKKTAPNPQKRMLYKLLMNSLYGKFGQRPLGGSWLLTGQELGLMIGADDFDGTSIELVRLMDKTLDLYELRLKRDSNDFNWIGSLVRLASYIAACARINLFEAVYTVGEHNVGYMDTDSIISKVELPKHMVDESELGKWKLEQMCMQVYLWGPKLYCIDNKAKLKGVTNNKIDIEAMNRDGEYVTKDNLAFRRFFGAVVVEKVNKLIKKMDSRRKWEGNRSTPR